MRRHALLLLPALLGLLAAAPTAVPPPVDGARFLLLIHDPAPTARPADEQAAIVAEYSAWAKELGAGGHLIAADELADEATVVTAKNPAGATRKSTAGGYFLLTAADLSAARALAANCPAIRHGGSVELTPVVDH